VLSGLGPRSNADASIAAPGTRVIIAAMTAAGVRLIVAISAGAVATMVTPGRPNPPKHDPGDWLIMRHLLTRVARAAFGNVDADLALMEEALRDSGLDWTAVRPPQLIGKPLTGSYRTALRAQPAPRLAHLPRRCRRFMLAVLDQPQIIWGSHRNRQLAGELRQRWYRSAGRHPRKERT